MHYIQHPDKNNGTSHMTKDAVVCAHIFKLIRESAIHKCCCTTFELCFFQIHSQADLWLCDALKQIAKKLII